MENKENQLPQNQAIPELDHKESRAQNFNLEGSKTKEKFPRFIIYSFFALFFMVIGVFGFWLYQNQFSKKNYISDNHADDKKTSISPSPTSAPPSSPRVDSEIVDFGTNTKKYINYEYGFSVVFPSYNKSATTCQEKQLNQTGEMPLKVFESPNNNTLFISEEYVLTVQHKQLSSGGYQYDFSTCKKVQNNINLIENGYDNGIPDINNLEINITKPNTLQVNYKKVASDDDLEALVQTLYNGCYVGEKNPLQNYEDVYQVKLTDKNGQNGPESECFTNFVYIFLYSPDKGVAVLTNGFQDAPFNGTNGQSEPKIEFLQ
jgi:hypothetical protein